jgi:hypothetical protein
MKSFQQFLEEAYFLLEKKKQYDDSHGFDRSKHPDLEVKYDRPRGKDQNTDRRGSTTIHHKPSGVTYTVGHSKRHSSDDEYEHMYDAKLGGKARTAHGHKPEHNVSWAHSKINDQDKMSPGEKLRTARNAKRVWDKHVQHRIPSGHLVSNEPEENPDDKRRNPDKNTRASIYKKSGFGKVDSWGKQYSTKIGKKFHPVHNDEDDED